MGREALVGRDQYSRIVGSWVGSIGLDPAAYGTHTLRRTKATLIYRRTRNLRAVQLLLGHTKLESTVRYLGIEVDDALEIGEQGGVVPRRGWSRPPNSTVADRPADSRTAPPVASAEWCPVSQPRSHRRSVAPLEVGCASDVTAIFGGGPPRRCEVVTVSECTTPLT